MKVIIHFSKWNYTIFLYDISNYSAYKNWNIELIVHIIYKIFYLTHFDIKSKMSRKLLIF